MDSAYRGKRDPRSRDDSWKGPDTVQEGVLHGHVIVPVSGTGLLYGYRAVIASMQAQYPSLVPPTMAELETIQKSDKVQAFGKEWEITDDKSEFHIEHLSQDP